jgi:lysophospholipase L1-like esterase
MRRRAAVLLVVALAVAACGGGDDGGGEPTPTTGARPSGYVALGDSFSAGVGAPPYDAASGKCQRSSLAWPKLLDAADDDLHLVAWPACGSAKVEHLLGPWDSRQLEAQVPSVPDPDVGLVTMTVGGNDAGFNDLVARCVLGDCSDVPGSSDFIATLTALTDRLATELYPAIRTAYPNARILHVGYPQLTPPPGEPLGTTCGWISTPAEQEAIAAIVAELDDALDAAVDLTTTKDVEYVDVTNAFAGHELCTATPWVNEVVTLDPGRAHPTSAGYEALAKTVESALD